MRKTRRRRRIRRYLDQQDVGRTSGNKESSRVDLLGSSRKYATPSKCIPTFIQGYSHCTTATHLSPPTFVRNGVEARKRGQIIIMPILGVSTAKSALAVPTLRIDDPVVTEDTGQASSTLDFESTEIGQFFRYQAFLREFFAQFLELILTPTVDTHQ